MREPAVRPPHLLAAVSQGEDLSSLRCHQGWDLLTRDTSGFQRNVQCGQNHGDPSVPMGHFPRAHADVSDTVV